MFAFCLFSVIAVSGAAATRELSSKKRARLRGQRDSQTQDGEPPARNLLHGDILLEAASNERELLGMIGNTETRNHIVRKPSGKGEKTRPVVHPLDIQERQGDEEDLEATPIDASVPEATSSDQEEEVEFEEEDARKEKSNKKEKGKDKGKDDNEEEEEEEKEAEDVVKDEVGDNEEEEEYERETEGAVRDEVDGNEEQEQQPEQKGKGKKDESATAEPEEEAELPEDDQGENYTVEDVPLSGKLDVLLAYL